MYFCFFLNWMDDDDDDDIFLCTRSIHTIYFNHTHTHTFLHNTHSIYALHTHTHSIQNIFVFYKTPTNPNRTKTHKPHFISFPPPPFLLLFLLIFFPFQEKRPRKQLHQNPTIMCLCITHHTHTPPKKKEKSLISNVHGRYKMQPHTFYVHIHII